MKISDAVCAVILLSLLSLRAVAAESIPEESGQAAVIKVISKYDAALEARSVERLAELVHPDLLILEGIHKNVGWADYRDNHIGPEMKEWKALKIEKPSIHDVELSGDLAFAVQEAVYTVTTGEKNTIMRVAETFVLRRSNGTWKIRHVHFSAKAEPTTPKK